jgi:hypothetical protein
MRLQTVEVAVWPNVRKQETEGKEDGKKLQGVGAVFDAWEVAPRLTSLFTSTTANSIYLREAPCLAGLASLV